MSNKTDVLSFDDWFNTYENLQCDKDSCEDAFEVGQQSKQDEINELKRELKFKDASIKKLKLQIENKQIDCDISGRKVEELQNKYDAMYRAFTVADDCRKEWHHCYMGARQREDELQKRIDEALHEADESCGVSVDAFVKLNRILKGDSHES